MRTSAWVMVGGLALLLAAAEDAVREGRADRAWFDDGAREEAFRGAATFATLTAHLRASGGDPRFADRIPADPPVVAELLSDITVAQHHGLVERAQLVRFEPRAADAVGPELAEVRATEYWVTRSVGAAGEAVRSDVVAVRYAMRRDAGGWRVADWAFDGGHVAEAPSR